MTLPVPLTVRLATGRTDRHITNEIRDLRFRSVVPGGYASCTVGLDRPLSIQPDEIALYGKLYVYDARTGRTVWEGRLEDPGRSAGGEGQVWDLVGIGPSAHAEDKTVPRIYVDNSTTRWERTTFSVKPARVEHSDIGADNETPSILLIAQEGMSINQGIIADIHYRTLFDCGMKLARVRTDFTNAITTSDYINRLVTRQGPNGGGTVVNNADWTSGTSSFNAARGSVLNPIPADHDVVNIRIHRAAAGSEVATANRWGEFWGMSVRALLKDINGSDITTDGYYVSPAVLAHEVVTDLIGRGDLDRFDSATAVIATTSYLIEQLAYPSGATPAQILADLMDFEPGFYWAAWESQPNGKHRFEWKQWPTTVRYEADAVDGYDSTGSAAGLYNQALVAYRDWRGRERTAIRSATVPELAAAGLTRTIHVDLGNELNSLANAQRAGDQALAEHATPPNAGALTVARPIVDLVRGTMVQPWEILPGELIRVRGILPRTNALNPVGRDGVTVFKIAAVEYDAAAAAARLELDSYSPSVARELARLAQRRRRR